MDEIGPVIAGVLVVIGVIFAAFKFTFTPAIVVTTHWIDRNENYRIDLEKDYSVIKTSPYEFIETDKGYDVVIHLEKD